MYTLLLHNLIVRTKKRISPSIFLLLLLLLIYQGCSCWGWTIRSHGVRWKGKVYEIGKKNHRKPRASFWCVQKETLCLYAEKCGSSATCRVCLRLCGVPQPWLEFLRVGGGGGGKSALENSAWPKLQDLRADLLSVLDRVLSRIHAECLCVQVTQEAEASRL